MRMDEKTHLIAVMGATGSGKTSFINLASGDNLVIGNSLVSCTSEVQTTRPFEVAGRSVTLIDTPGFDDTTKSDTEILNLISAHLEIAYEHGKCLTGVIFIHRISDYRMGGISKRNFSMFRKLCGDSTLKNVAIVTNMWGQVDRATAEAREEELRSKDIFFKPALDKQAKFLRHYNTIDTAHVIIRSLLDNVPQPLQIQVELVDEGKTISETAAGEELTKELRALQKRHENEMKKLRDEMAAAMRLKDEETRKELEEERQKMAVKIKQLEDDATNMASKYDTQKAELESRMQAIQDDARAESQQMRSKHDEEMQILKLELDKAKSDIDKASLMRRMDQLSQQINSLPKPRGGICVIQ